MDADRMALVEAYSKAAQSYSNAVREAEIVRENGENSALEDASRLAADGRLQCLKAKAALDAA